jgi:hypothetical protein
LRDPSIATKPDAVRQPERDYSHRTLFEKLGVRAHFRVSVRNGVDPGFIANLDQALRRRSSPSLRGKYDLIFLQINRLEDLAAIAKAAQHLQAEGGLWVFHPKGKGASPTDAQVRHCGIASGLVDNKICAYTATHTATRFVIPRAMR